MKIQHNTKPVHNNIVTNASPTNIVKKSGKSNKKQHDKSQKNIHSSESQEKVKPKSPRLSEKGNNGDKKNGKSGGNTGTEFSENKTKKESQLEEKRKQEEERKSLKKVDYQRLETVLEEEQLSSEETLSKTSSRRESNGTVGDCSDTNKGSQETVIRSPKRQRSFNVLEPQGDKTTFEPGLINKKSRSRSEVLIVPDEYQAPLVESSWKETAKRSLNGMIEILPIFSNDKFVCSRDTISIEECDDLEALDKVFCQTGKNGPTETRSNSGKQDGDAGSESENSKMSSKPKSKKSKNERKLRSKMLTDKSHRQKTSSPFINSLLVLSPFSAEREKLSRTDDEERKLLSTESRLTAALQESRLFETLSNMRPVSAVIFATLGVLTIFLGLAWRSYEPPRLIDYILEFLPFFHRRRTLIQLFFDRLLKMLSEYFCKPCKDF